MRGLSRIVQCRMRSALWLALLLPGLTAAASVSQLTPGEPLCQIGDRGYWQVAEDAKHQVWLALTYRNELRAEYVVCWVHPEHIVEVLPPTKEM